MTDTLPERAPAPDGGEYYRGVYYPPDAWLRGYFSIRDDDRKGEQRIKGVRKNLDYLRLKDFAIHLLHPKPGMRVLDVGCAGGATMIDTGLQGAEVYGQDLDGEMVMRANRELARWGIDGEVKAGDAVELQFPDRYFDGAYSHDFLEHVTEDTKVRALREIRRVLKPDAPVVLKHRT
jgi:2-polyprenyl-3-methyl-5-hydroxy-6-metoxy-1,4-benzoquinol methylase